MFSEADREVIQAARFKAREELARLQAGGADFGLVHADVLRENLLCGPQGMALIDFDVHHGNGSEDIFKGDERVLMCSIFEKGLYPFNGEEAKGLNMVNVGLPSRSGGDKFREAVTDYWMPALDAFRPELIYISAGFDAHREDDMGNLGLVEADYEWVTKQLMQVANRHCKGRIISCLEGGYVLSPLARSVGAHVKVLIGAD